MVSAIPMVVAYTTEGTLISGRNRLEIDEERNRNIERMAEAGIQVFDQPCRDLPSNLPESTYEHDELRRRRSADDGELALTETHSKAVCLAVSVIR